MRFYVRVKSCDPGFPLPSAFPEARYLHTARVHPGQEAARLVETAACPV